MLGSVRPHRVTTPKAALEEEKEKIVESRDHTAFQQTVRLNS